MRRTKDVADNLRAHVPHGALVGEREEMVDGKRKLMEQLVLEDAHSLFWRLEGRSGLLSEENMQQ
jgi:hypothetical protein